MVTLYHCCYCIYSLYCYTQPADIQTKLSSEEKQKDPGGVIYLHVMVIPPSPPHPCVCKGIHNSFLFVQAKSKSKTSMIAEAKQPSTGKVSSSQTDKAATVTSGEGSKVEYK